jgi:hypothetical protein
VTAEKVDAAASGFTHPCRLCRVTGVSRTMIDVNIDPLAPTIFHESWWLEIATEGRYSVAEVSEYGKVVGRLPYFLRKKMGLSIVGLAPLTHFLGPAIVKPASLQRLYITKELISKLPPTSACYIKCHRDVQDIIAFQSAGFRSSVQFTHEIHPQPADVLWKNANHKGRRMIRRGGELHSVSAGNDPAAFIEFYRQSIETKGKTNRMDPAVCTRLVQACLERDRGRIYEAKDQAGDLAASIFCAWDQVASYYLMTARHPKSHWGAASLLVWQAITDAAKRGLIFDFDGFANEGGARFAYNFTSNVTPRYIATRDSAPVRVIHAAKSIFQERNLFW